ncbi:MAG: DUF1018 domain-containing protein [Zoogloeaceae bacterium]|nr:DUF1018 domain-containing protein [Zoogloeaceae bacterium]
MPKLRRSPRNTALGLVHKGAAIRFEIRDWSEGGADADAIALYRAWLADGTGHSSARELSIDQLDAKVRELRRGGYLDARKTRGGQGAGGDRPTQAQVDHIGGLARDLGWSRGWEDPNLTAFVVRTAKVSHQRMLSRAGATKIISGLEHWLAQRRAHEVAP